MATDFSYSMPFSTVAPLYCALSSTKTIHRVFKGMSCPQSLGLCKVLKIFSVDPVEENRSSICVSQTVGAPVWSDFLDFHEGDSFKRDLLRFQSDY